MKKIFKRTKRLFLNLSEIKKVETKAVKEGEKQRPLGFAITSAPSLFSADFSERNKWPS